MDWKTVGDIAGAVIIVGGILFGVIRYLKSIKAKKAGLAANPTRCIDHDHRIVALEVCMGETKAKLDGIDKKVDDVSEDVKTLITMHLKP
jgi:hypothetical protein